jgi:peptide/histidine transporter 3/4
MACKNKYPKNDTALTYQKKTIPSQIDLGKAKYGGPFFEPGEK